MENEEEKGEDFATFEARAKAAEAGEEVLELTEEVKTEEKPAEDAEQPESDETSEEEADDEEPKEKRKNKPESERIRSAISKQRAAERRADDLEARFADLEKRLLPENSNDTSNSEPAAPDPNDLRKYPLGSLDDQFIKDAIEWQTDRKTSAAISALLQRQEEAAQRAEAAKQDADLRSKADELISRGAELFDDFEETVVNNDNFVLTQITFEAAAEAEHGVRILHELAQNEAEAHRVAKLSLMGQLRFVMDKDAEIAAKGQSRKIPQAGGPPATTLRGVGARKTISPDTTDFAEFERLAKASNR